MLEINHRQDINKIEILFGDNGLMVGTYWMVQGKSKLEKKLFIRQGYKHLLFRAEALDTKVVKQDIVQVRVLILLPRCAS
jgi:hypothetical protein